MPSSLSLNCCLFTLVALLTSTVRAGVFFNAPKAGYEWDATQPQLVKWRESGSGNHTSLQELGTLTVSLLANSGKDRVEVAVLGTVPATAKEFSVTFPTDVGKSANQYYIHVKSGSVDRDYTSSKFALSNMTSDSFVAMGASTNSTSTSTTGSLPGVGVGTIARTTATSKAAASNPTSAASRTTVTSAAILAILSVGVVSQVLL